MAARNYPLTDKAIFHSDRGSNYTSQQFAGTLKKHNLRHSVGRTGICYDNAMAESFFAALKNERVHRTQYPTREHARRDVVRYIEFWHNSKRRHSGLQYRTHGRSTRNTWNGSPQRELTTNTLPGKLGADHRPTRRAQRKTLDAAPPHQRMNYALMPSLRATKANPAHNRT